MNATTKGRKMTRQRTFYVEGQKITIKSRSVSYQRNPAGFNVWINGEKFFSNHLERDKAEDSCYVKWVNGLENKPCVCCGGPAPEDSDYCGYRCEDYAREQQAAYDDEWY